MSQEKMIKAKSLIQQKRYNEARSVLKGLNNPTAQKWLAKLDEIAPENKPKPSNAIIYIGGLIITLLIGIIIGGVVLNSISSNSKTTNEASSLPTQMVLPSSTSTETLPPSSTPTNTQTFTPSPTNTRPPTYTRAPSITPRPTSTPRPTYTPTVTIPPQVAQIGPIYDDLYQETYSVEVSLHSVTFTQGEGVERTSQGKIYAIAEITVRNLGPGILRGISSMSFQAKDAQGAVRDVTYIFFRDCDLDFVDLTAGGNVDGCVAFEVPASGSLELIYAPYLYNGLQEGRYISFRIR